MLPLKCVERCVGEWQRGAWMERLRTTRLDQAGLKGLPTEQARHQAALTNHQQQPEDLQRTALAPGIAWCWASPLCCTGSYLQCHQATAATTYDSQSLRYHTRSSRTPNTMRPSHTSSSTILKLTSLSGQQDEGIKTFKRYVFRWLTPLYAWRHSSRG